MLQLLIPQIWPNFRTKFIKCIALKQFSKLVGCITKIKSSVNKLSKVREVLEGKNAQNPTSNVQIADYKLFTWCEASNSSFIVS